MHSFIRGVKSPRLHSNFHANKHKIVFHIPPLPPPPPPNCILMPVTLFFFSFALSSSCSSSSTVANCWEDVLASDKASSYQSDKTSHHLSDRSSLRSDKSSQKSDRSSQKSDISSQLPDRPSLKSDKSSRLSDRSSNQSEKDVAASQATTSVKKSTLHPKSDRAFAHRLDKTSHVSFEDEVEVDQWNRSLDKTTSAVLCSSVQRINCSLDRRRQTDETSLLSLASRTLPKFSNGNYIVFVTRTSYHTHICDRKQRIKGLENSDAL